MMEIIYLRGTNTWHARRPHQREIILAALEGKDVFVQAATSFGKSLCFQLPAVIDRGSAFLGLEIPC